jgi:hypothetical protein
VEDAIETLKVAAANLSKQFPAAAKEVEAERR